MPNTKRTRTLLVVDDDVSICETLRLIGEGCGFRVSTSNTAEEFRAGYTASCPDYITLDLGLGNSDGIELLRWLANQKSRSTIILISGYDSKVMNAAALLGRAHALIILATLQKPIDIEHLKCLLQLDAADYDAITQKNLSDAIEKNEFKLYYQPKIDIKTRKLIGAEALIRWYHETLQFIPAESSIGLAEKSGLIYSLSDWVNHEAIKQCALFKKNGYDFVISINISAKLLHDLTLPETLANLTQQYGIEPRNICIEITESTAMANPAISLDILTRFRIKGFSLSIDDFGTGYSSLVELQRMPCSELKIDKSFIMNLTKNSPEYIIARSIIQLGHEFGLTVVAEGVETAKTFELLKELGCDIAQGYYVGYPMSISEFNTWLQLNITDEMIYKVQVNHGS